MRRILVLSLMVFFAAGAVYAAEQAAEPKAPVVVPTYSVIKEKSFLKFFAIQNNAPLEGAFDNFTADIKFDPDHPELSSIHAEVETGSVRTADDEIAKNLKMPDWFSSAAFPKAILDCKKLSRMPSSDNYYAGFNGADFCQLTIRGKSAPAVLNFQMEHFDGTNAIAKGNITVHRKDFGIGQGQWAKDDVIKDEVRVEFRIAATKK